jgi:hypothetical protein
MEVNMKNKKWLWWTLTILLTLVVLAGVAFAGFRFGVMQSVNLTAEGTTAFMFHHGRGFDHGMPKEFGMLHGFERGHGFGGRGGFGFFSPLFGLFHIAVVGGLIWLAYTFIKRSGWRVVNVNAQQASPTPEVVEAEEKKDQA